jgi:hypothetical protein
MDAIGPDVDVTFRRQIAPLPRGVFVKPAVVCTENPIRVYRMIESAKLAR